MRNALDSSYVLEKDKLVQRADDDLTSALIGGRVVMSRYFLFNILIFIVISTFVISCTSSDDPPVEGDADSSGDADRAEASLDGDVDHDLEMEPGGDADTDVDADADGDLGHWVTGEPDEEHPVLPMEVDISGVGTFSFDPQNVVTTRPDLFRPGFFSLFDVLNFLSERGDISLEHHFDTDLDTHVIDDLEGASSWWYDAYYDGGWSESSVHRMDYYPVKDRMRITFERVERTVLDRRESIWRTEVARRATEGGRIVVPQVTIRGPRGEMRTFENVEVTPHDLRSDMLVSGTVTAIDIIMSLGDQGRLTYGIVWYNRMGSAAVGNYVVEAIDDDVHSGACGFVYEVGEQEDRGGSHIHVMPDMRILQSPDYALFYWIQLGPC